jgi:hypothetical protein
MGLWDRGCGVGFTSINGLAVCYWPERRIVTSSRKETGLDSTVILFS